MDESTRFQEVRRLFLEVRGMEHGERTAYLEMHSSDECVRTEVEGLLASHDEPSTFLSTLDTGAVEGRDDAGALPERVGQYRVVGLIGEGGMGAVYEAVQDSPKRRVAIKVLRPGLGGAGMLRRFQLESEILGKLHHPNIAQVVEAGTFDNNRPFFAMEYIDGESLRDYVRTNSLGDREIIRLVIDVCEGVRHAHARGVIHRDLKPSNILVDAEGRVRVLDFGIARASDADVQVTTVGTRAGDLVGTIAYMSPEQLSGRSDSVDSRSDVYALGVIAYELLSGALPVDVRGTTIADAIIKARDHEPRALASLDRRFSGDLSTVVMKAMSKDAERRYQTADAFSDDLRRYLDNQPVQARPPTAAYQMRKFASRNKGLVGAAGVFVVMLIAGVVTTSLALAEAIEAKRAAEEERAIAEAVNGFLNNDLLAGIDPASAESRDITMREVLAAASERVDERFEDQPIVAASVHGTLASMYRNLGHSEDEERHRDAVLEIFEREYGSDDMRTLDALNNLATAYMEQGRFGDAVPIYERVYEARVRLLGKEDERVAMIQSNLAAAMLQEGRIEEAMPILEENLVAKRRLFGDDDPSTLTTMNNLAGMYVVREEHAKAVELYELVVAGRTAALWAGSPRTLFARSAREWSLSQIGRADEAKADLLDAMQTVRERLDPDHPIVLRMMNSLSVAHMELGEFEEAIVVLEEMRELSISRYGEVNGHTTNAVTQVGIAHYRSGAHEEAVEHLTRAVDLADRSMSEFHWSRGNARTWLALALIGEERYSEAEPLLLESYKILSTNQDSNRSRIQKTVGALIDLYVSTGREEEAERWRNLD